MYYDIFFSNPQGEIVEQPDPPVDGVLIQFPGPKQAVVYAVSDRGGKRFHCLVTPEQLQQLDDDQVAYKFFDTAEASFKNGNAPNHVFNPAGCVYKKNGKDYIHRVGKDTEEELSPTE